MHASTHAVNNFPESGFKLNLGEIASDMSRQFKHKITERLIVDYGWFKDKNSYQFHIFPNIDKTNKFLPNNDAFCTAVEKTFLDALGTSAEVSADFQEKSSTRYRGKDGALGGVQFPYPVPYLWISVDKVPGNLIPPDRLLEQLVEAVVATTENLGLKS